MGRRRAPEYDNAPSIDQRLQTRDKQDTSVGGKAVDVYDQVIGAHATTTYHLESCDLLEGVGRPERILFNSPFDALDGGYKPCPRCRPGP